MKCRNPRGFFVLLALVGNRSNTFSSGKDVSPGTDPATHFSCLPVGLCTQPEPLEVEPHQMHLLAPGP